MLDQTSDGNKLHGPAINLPLDRPIVETIKEAIAKYGTPTVAARELGIDAGTCQLVDRLLRYLPLLPPIDRATCELALEAIDSERRIANARRNTRSILARFPKHDLLFGKNIIDEVMRGMSAHPKQPGVAAKMIGMDRDGFAFIRKLLILRDQHITQQDKSVIEHALDKIEQERGIKSVRRMVAPVLARLWHARSIVGVIDLSTKAKKHQARLDSTLLAIRESCESTRDLKLPRNLTPDDARKALTELAVSSELIAHLIRRLLGDGEENGEHS
jgi:hypothetical protein